MSHKGEVKVGDKVYIQEHWTGLVFRGKVYEVGEEGVLVHGENFIDLDGSDAETFYGSTGGTWDNVYLTPEEAFEAIKRKNLEKIKKYCDEIVDVKTLIEFPTNHCFCGEEYTNYEALEAYKIRAKELLGIDIKGD